MKTGIKEQWLETQMGIIEKYYDIVVSKKGKRFQKYSFSTNNTVVCPLHDDNDPSMGVIVSKGKERFHCFGCGKWGNVVDLAVRTGTTGISGGDREKNADLIISLLGLEVPSSLLEGTETKESKLHPVQKRRKAIQNKMHSFGRDDFRQGIVGIVRKERKIGYLDSLLITSIMESLKEQ